MQKEMRAKREAAKCEKKCARSAKLPSAYPTKPCNAYQLQKCKITSACKRSIKVGVYRFACVVVEEKMIQ